jgi:IS1 family transposase
LGDVWTFIALNADTKLIPSFRVGQRMVFHTQAFIDDLAGRMATRVQLSSDSMHAYAQTVEKTIKIGMPDMNETSTSHVEKQNQTLRMHCRRLTPPHQRTQQEAEKL